MIRAPSDLSEVCRLCLQPGERLTNIFDNLESLQPENISLSSKIMNCVSVKISPTDPGPRKICNNCMDNVNRWYQFNEDCKSVDLCLQRYLNEMTIKHDSPPKVDDVTNAICENSLLNEFSLSSFDSTFGKNMNFSSILDVYFNGEMPQIDDETDKPIDYSLTAVVDTNSGATTTEPVITQPDFSELDRIKAPKKRRKGHSCELCDRTFIRFDALLNHDDTVHQNVFREFSCHSCGRLFISQSRLKTHEYSHREKTHPCPICNKLFASAKSLEVHSRLHSGKYKCKTCGFVSTSKLYLEEHLLKHVGNETVYRCKFCSVSFKLRSSLLRHEYRHLKHEGKIYKCSVCSIAIRRRCDLQNHMAMHNSDNVSEYKCDLCSKVYKSKRTLRAHLVRHEEAQLVCDVCDKKFHSNYELREHAGTHSHEKRFPCFHCNKNFSFRSTLNKHLKSNIPRVRSDIAVI